jgi:hypothetical protein
VARLIQHEHEGGASIHVVTHEAPAGELQAALSEIAALPECRAVPSVLAVISDRGVSGLGWS